MASLCRRRRKRHWQSTMEAMMPYAPGCSHHRVEACSAAQGLAGFIGCVVAGEACGYWRCQAVLNAQASLPPQHQSSRLPPRCPRHGSRLAFKGPPACLLACILSDLSPRAVLRRATSVCPQCAVVERPSHFLRLRLFRHSFVRPLQPLAGSPDTPQSIRYH